MLLFRNKGFYLGTKPIGWEFGFTPFIISGLVSAEGRSLEVSPALG
jgi:hypothetical protein